MSADRGITKQEERYVIWFGLFLGGNLRWGDDLWRLLVPQNRQKIGGVRLFKTVRLIRRIRYVKWQLAIDQEWHRFSSKYFAK